jgi:hypothetical protein
MDNRIELFILQNRGYTLDELMKHNMVETTKKMLVYFYVTVTLKRKLNILELKHGRYLEVFQLLIASTFFSMVSIDIGGNKIFAIIQSVY